MRNEKQFMMLFRFTPDQRQNPTAEEEKQMHQAWGQFIGELALKEKLINTYQLGFEGQQLNAQNELTEGIHLENKITLGGNMVVRANSLAEATEMARQCPILHMGGSVEIRNILPMDNA
ncbi:YciI family protein [Jiulongibacter sp. NS-SX5]|uniref:YciI family protein n=1 Tax=Jiulongibacter sp. NS-SX5 TaxID=3463854 RepID=UPI00405842FC